MAIGAMAVGNATPITASALLKTGPGSLLGFFCVSSTSGTVTVYDNTAGSGTVLLPTVTLAAATFYPFPVAFGTGLYVAVGGTLSVVPVWV